MALIPKDDKHRTDCWRAPTQRERERCQRNSGGARRKGGPGKELEFFPSRKGPTAATRARGRGWNAYICPENTIRKTKAYHFSQFVWADKPHKEVPKCSTLFEFSCTWGFELSTPSSSLPTYPPSEPPSSAVTDPVGWADILGLSAGNPKFCPCTRPATTQGTTESVPSPAPESQRSNHRIHACISTTCLTVGWTQGARKEGRESGK